MILKISVFICLDVLNTGIQETVQNKPVFICLDVLNTGIQETVENKPVLYVQMY